MSRGDDGLYQSARDRLSQPRMCEPVQPSINRADAKSFSQQSDVNRTSEDPNRRSQGAYHEAIDCALFATHGTHGVLDLGASKTVIGSQHLAGPN